MKRYKTSGVLCVVAGAATALLMSAGLARADEATFAEHLSDNGFPVTDVTYSLGHAICSEITANGVQGVEKEMRLGIKNMGSGEDAATIVFYSAYDLCPSALPAVRAWADAVKHAGTQGA